MMDNALAPAPSQASQDDTAPPAIGDWLDAAAAQVEHDVFAMIDRHANTQRQADLLQAILRGALAARGVDGGVCRVAMRLPLLVHAAMRGDIGADAMTLASALTLLEAGIYTFDHILDREIEGPLAQLPPGQILLGAACLLSHLPNQVLLQIQGGAEAGVPLTGMLANGLAVIAAGQLEDMAAADEAMPTSVAIQRAVEMKTGERRSLYATLAARLAGASDDRIVSLGQYGKELGTARQLRSDLQDLYGPQPSRDLASGTLTLPLVLFLEQADAAGRDAMRALLANPNDVPERQRTVCRLLREAGILRQVAIRLEQHCRSALAHLARARPDQRVTPLLREMAQNVSLLGAQS
jgi:hypothetical protein